MWVGNRAARDRVSSCNMDDMEEAPQRYEALHWMMDERVTRL